jgi:hypothetical protein
MGLDDLTLCENPDKKQEYSTIEDCYIIKNESIILKDTCTDTIFVPNV